jgi:hypothetical protein
MNVPDEITWVTTSDIGVGVANPGVFQDIEFKELKSELFEKSAQELMAYETPITNILEDNPMKEEYGMQTMTFPKSKVLEALKKNRAIHLKIVQEAQKGFREKAIELTEKLLSELKEGLPVQLIIPLHLPDNHIDDFDRAIDMLSMSTGKTVNLNEGEFQMFVRNKWNWQHQFLANNAMYSATARHISED